IGLGFRSISMNANAVGPVKTMIRGLRLRPLQDYMKTLMTGSDHSLRDKLRAFAHDHGVPVS
ncbi:MAG: hypothetical protein ACKVJQ_04690, partial [Alphaproteobacteria bacterium]